METTDVCPMTLRRPLRQTTGYLASLQERGLALGQADLTNPGSASGLLGLVPAAVTVLSRDTRLRLEESCELRISSKALTAGA